MDERDGEGRVSCAQGLDDEVCARHAQGEDTGGRSTGGNRRDVKGIIACALAGGSIVAVIVGYLVAVGAGVAFTLLCSPLLVVSFILSALSLKSESRSRAGRVGMALSIGGLVCLWVFAWGIGLISLFVGLDPSSLDELGPFALLNWD